MPGQPTKPRVIKLPGHYKRIVASKLLEACPNDSTSKDLTPQPSTTIICISDTHNTQPHLPPGDLLLHAGDLTEHGSFDELQTQISWLAAQPHAHKVAIAGNHDVLLDAEFMAEHPERDYASNAGRTARDLDWSGVTYLAPGQSVELDITPSDAPPTQEKPHQSRRVHIYGQPLTPQYGLSAFQHPPTHDPWTHRVPSGTNILLTHGPPRNHLDGVPGGLKHVGDMCLAREVRRVRPRLVVFGHIHVGARREDLVLHGARRAWERVGEGGPWMDVLLVGFCAVGRWCVPAVWRDSKVTTLVNAAVVGGSVEEARVVRI